MALIKMGALVSNISGKIGGQTLGNSRTGNYIRNTGSVRKNPSRDSRQALATNSISAQQWRTLSQFNRNTFNAASEFYSYQNRLGESKKRSGYEIFIMLKNNLRLQNPSLLPSPMPKKTFSTLSNWGITSSYESVIVYAEGAEDNVLYRLFCTKPGSRGVSAPYQNFYFMEEGLSFGGNLNIDFWDAQSRKWNITGNSLKVFLRVDAIDLLTGQCLKSIYSNDTLFNG